MRPALYRVVLLAFLVTAAGCSRRHAPAPSSPAPSSPPPAPMPAADPPSAGGAFDRLGIHLEWPPGWAQRTSNDFVLSLAPTKSAGENPAPQISLDVPVLPPHIPGMIPIGSVRNGYVDYLRKAEGPLKTQDLKPPPVPAAAARLVRSTWKAKDGEEQQETALLLVHADRVYIVRARSSTREEPATRQAFDQVVGSLKWIRP